MQAGEVVGVLPRGVAQVLLDVGVIGDRWGQSKSIGLVIRPHDIERSETAIVGTFDLIGPAALRQHR